MPRVARNRLDAAPPTDQPCRGMAPLKIEYRLVGAANNVHIEIFGNGTLDAMKRSLKIGLSCAPPALTLDPAIVVFGGLDWLLALGEGIPKDDAAVVRTLTQVLDEDGREVGESKMVFAPHREGSRLLVHGEFARCSCRLEVGERVTNVGRVSAVRVPGTADACVVTSVATFATGRGHDYRATSTATIGIAAAGERDRPTLTTTEWRLTERVPHSVKISASARNDGRSTTRRT